MVLSELIRDPTWTDETKFLDNLRNQAEDAKSEAALRIELDESYHELFARVADRLYGLVHNRNINPKDASIDAEVLPPLFRVNNQVGSPDDVPPWIERERERIDSLEARNDLVNTFVLLMVLGAFGSMIFLTRDYIRESEDRASIAAYVFRPVLGIFLAVAMFVIDVLLHTIVSEGGMTAVRREPLYLLAFAAGLLSEQAYTLVHSKAESALIKYGGSSGTNAAGTQSGNTH